MFFFVQTARSVSRRVLTEPRRMLEKRVSIQILHFTARKAEIMRSTSARLGMSFIVLFTVSFFLSSGFTPAHAQTTAPKAASFTGTPKHGVGERVSLEEIARQADVVAVGTVDRLRSEWNANKSRIQTRVTIRVEQPLKGAPPGVELTVLVPGGEVDGVGEVYSHTDRFRQEEEVVVVAKRDSRGTLRIATGDRGKLLITHDQATGKRIIQNVGTLDEVTARVVRALKASPSDTQQEH